MENISNTTTIEKASDYMILMDNKLNGKMNSYLTIIIKDCISRIVAVMTILAKDTLSKIINGPKGSIKKTLQINRTKN